MTIALSPAFETDSLRIVLSWDKDPKDLDIHMMFEVDQEDSESETGTAMTYLCNVGFY